VGEGVHARGENLNVVEETLGTLVELLLIVPNHLCLGGFVHGLCMKILVDGVILQLLEPRCRHLSNSGLGRHDSLCHFVLGRWAFLAATHFWKASSSFPTVGEHATSTSAFFLISGAFGAIYTSICFLAQGPKTKTHRTPKKAPVPIEMRTRMPIPNFSSSLK
jgi:hypothetical protein